MLSYKSWVSEGRIWIWLTSMAVSLVLLALGGILFILFKNALPAFWAYDVVEASYSQTCEDTSLTTKKYATILSEDESSYILKQSHNHAINSIISTCKKNTTFAPTSDVYSIYRINHGELFGKITKINLNGNTGNLSEFFELSKNLQFSLKKVYSDILQQKDNSKLDSLYAEEDLLKAKLLENYILVESDEGVVKLHSDDIDDYILASEANVFTKAFFYLKRFYKFLTEDPREANTSGGIFPAIFGTMLMVIIMSIFVTPIGVLVAIYLNEYAKQNLLTKIIRMSINNLASVPSVVYGIFGLTFFVYFVGGSLDKLLFSDTLPSPTFGTPGLLWCSLTLAILTIPTVVITTEEGLTRVPKMIKNGSLALGATKYETIKNLVIPITMPSIITGLILAISRAAGEVAPLMLVGVVKFSAELPLDSSFPFLHLDQKIMHLGFHIFDLGFQNPNIELVKPLVYMSALVLLVLVISLNFIAMIIRDRLRKKFKALE